MAVKKFTPRKTARISRRIARQAARLPGQTATAAGPTGPIAAAVGPPPPQGVPTGFGPGGGTTGGIAASVVDPAATTTDMQPPTTGQAQDMQLPVTVARPDLPAWNNKNRPAGMNNQQWKLRKRQLKIESREQREVEEHETGQKPEDIIWRAERDMESANRANEERYQKALDLLTGASETQAQQFQDVQGAMTGAYGDIRSTMEDLYGRSAAASEGLGASAIEDINIGARRLGAQGEQDLISRGLGNTTIRGSMMRGVEADRARGVRGVSEDEARREQERLMSQAGVMGNLGMNQATAQANLGVTGAQAGFGAAGSIAGLIGSRTDVGPDYGTIAQLLESLSTQGSQLDTPGVTDPTIGGGGGPIMPTFGPGQGFNQGIFEFPSMFGREAGGGGASSSGGTLPGITHGVGGGGGITSISGTGGQTPIQQLIQPPTGTAGPSTTEIIAPTGEVHTGAGVNKPLSPDQVKPTGNYKYYSRLKHQWRYTSGEDAVKKAQAGVKLYSANA